MVQIFDVYSLNLKKCGAKFKHKFCFIVKSHKRMKENEVPPYSILDWCQK